MQETLKKKENMSQIITKSEAQEALEAHYDGAYHQYSVDGEPDVLCDVAVFPVRVWVDEFVDWEDVMFFRKDGKVKVYASLN